MASLQLLILNDIISKDAHDTFLIKFPWTCFKETASCTLRKLIPYEVGQSNIFGSNKGVL